MSDQRKRASLGFESELNDLDPSSWESKVSKEKPSPALVKQAGEAVGFLSREAKVIPASVTPTSPRQQRRRRTGRNAQFNIKTKPETIEAFVAIADAQGWGIGEAFEIATDLLQRKYRAS